MLPSLKYTNNFWSAPQPGSFDEYLLAHQSRDNSYAGLPTYSLLLNIRLKRVPPADENSNEPPIYVYTRDQLCTYANTHPLKYKVKQDAFGNLAALLEFKMSTVIYVQPEYPLDTPEDRGIILATGKYRSIAEYDKWAAEDYWYTSEETHYKYIEVPYIGEPTKAEKLFVLTEQSRRAPKANGGSSAQPVRNEHTDFRPYRPIDFSKPHLLPSSLVDGLSSDQRTVEQVADDILSSLLAPDYLSQSSNSRSYQTENFPFSIEQRAKSPNVEVSNLRAAIEANPTDYIELMGYSG